MPLSTTAVDSMLSAIPRRTCGIATTESINHTTAKLSTGTGAFTNFHSFAPGAVELGEALHGSPLRLPAGNWSDRAHYSAQKATRAQIIAPIANGKFSHLQQYAIAPRGASRVVWEIFKRS